MSKIDYLDKSQKGISGISVGDIIIVHKRMLDGTIVNLAYIAVSCHLKNLKIIGMDLKDYDYLFVNLSTGLFVHDTGNGIALFKKSISEYDIKLYFLKGGVFDGYEYFKNKDVTINITNM